MAKTLTRKRRQTSQGLIAFGAFAGLLLQMAWATAHYPMLLANLGTTQSGVAVRTMVLCVHRANEQKIFDKLNQNRISDSTLRSKSNNAIANQSPIDRASDDKQAPPADDLCTFSIAVTGNDVGNTTNLAVIPSSVMPTDRFISARDEQKTASTSYLAAQGRAPPA